MKKEIFRVCTIGLVSMLLITGCSKNEEEVTKIRKDDEIKQLFDSGEDKDTTDSVLTDDIEEDDSSNIDEQSNSNVISNSNIKSNTTSNNNTVSKVVKIDTKTVELKDEGVYKIYVVATDSKGKTVWTADIGTIPRGSDAHNMAGYEGKKYYYIANAGKLKALNLQTGKTAWTISVKSEMAAPFFREYGDKLYIFSGMPSTNALDVIDLKTGKQVYYAGELENYIIKEDSKFDFEEYYILSTTNLKIDNNKITMEVIDYDDNDKVVLIGYFEINTNNYKISFKKIK